MSENQKDGALLERNISTTSYRDDITRKLEPKWDSASVGCYEATTDFGSRFVRNLPSDTNITIVATVNFGINARVKWF